MFNDDNDLPFYRSIMLKGGRLTKVAGIIGSYAPSLGTVMSNASRTLALGVTLMAGPTLFGGATALANDECGPAVAGGMITCDAGTYTDSGDGSIDYRGIDGLEIESSGLNLIVTPTDPDKEGLRISTGPNPASTGDMSIQWTSGTIVVGDVNNIGTSDSVSNGNQGDGLRAENQGQGATSVTLLDGEITTYGFNAQGMYAWQRNNNEDNSALATADFSGADSKITTSGRFSAGVYGRTDTGLGDVIVTATEGTIITNGRNSHGVRGFNNGESASAAGDVNITLGDGLTVTTSERKSSGGFASNKGAGIAKADMTDGMIETSGSESHGLYAQAIGTGDASAEMSGGTITVNGESAHGLYALALEDGDATALQAGGDIIANGTVAAGGVRALALKGGDAMASQTGGTVTTNGGRVVETVGGVDISTNSDGVMADAYEGGVATALQTGDGTITVSADGDGNAANAILARATGGGEAIATMGDGSDNPTQILGTLAGLNNFGGQGVEALAIGGGNATATMNSGTMTSYVGGTQGIRSLVRGNAAAADSKAIQNGGDIEINGGTTDAGNGYMTGILATNTGEGLAQATQNGGTLDMTNAGNQGAGVQAQTSAGADAIAEQTGAGTIITNGDGAAGLYALADGDGNATANATGGGTITTNGGDGAASFGAHGIFANARGDGAASIELSGASTIVTGADGQGDNAEGLFALSNGAAGDATIMIDNDGGSVETTGENADGVVAQVEGRGATHTGGATVTIESGMITTNGLESEGVVAQVGESGSFADLLQIDNGDATVNLNGGDIITLGDNSAGAESITDVLGSGNAIVNMNGGTVTTSGDENGAPIRGSHGLGAFALGTGEANVTQTAGDVMTSGEQSHGIFTLATSGMTTVNQGPDATTQATGVGADGISAGGDSVTVDIAGLVSGGRVGGVNSFGGAGEHGAGIHAAAGTPGGSFAVPSFMGNNKAVDITLAATGSVGALSDHAIKVDGGTATIINDGTITGYVSLWDNDDTFTNNSSNSFNVRNFADTDGDANFTRDTENVAVNDFGAGSDTFDNTASGTVRLLTVEDTSAITADLTDDTAPTSWLTSGVAEYASAAEGNATTAARTIETAGVEEAHFTNLETFTNSGTITMQDAETGGTTAVWGDVMVITGNAEVESGMADGGGVFQSNSGELRIDTHFNDGVMDMSDILVVDSTVTTGGATIIDVAAVDGGVGAGTDVNNNGMIDDGEGILVVEVLGDSAADAFALATPSIEQDGVLYFLNQSVTGGDWYLANRLDINGTGVCDGSVNVSGSSSEVLGCVSADTITASGSASVTGDIEGAGGADVIDVIGSASVLGTIFGGGNGQDESAAEDTGDIITVDTTGTIGAIDGQLGDDMITLNNGTITGSVDGGLGDDTLNWTGAGTLGGFNGGDGSDIAIISATSGYDGTQIIDGGDDVSAADGFTDTLTVNGKTITTAGANLINWENINIDGGELTISDGALTVGSEPNTGLTLMGGTLKSSLAALNITGNLNNNGIVDMQNSAAGDSIAVSGDYAGTGELLVDVDFASDTSDTLDVAGDIIGGSTLVRVQDVTAGGPTGNDITIVNFGGTSNPGDFVLAGPVVNGVFNYDTLAQDGQTWELQSGGYTPIASAVEGLGRSLLTLESLPTLNQRQSIQNDRERLSHPAPAGTEPAANRSVWMRIVGGEQEQDSNRSTTGADFDTELWRVQAGANRQIMNNDKGRFVLGLNGSYSEGDTNVSALAGRSSIDTEGLSVGVTGTWYAPTDSGYDGLYVDTQAQRSSYVSDISGSAVRGATNNEGADHIENIDSDGLSFSVEMGQRIALESENDLSVTPQAQLVYSKVDFDGFTGRNNVVVESDEAKSLQARVGLTVDTQIRHQAGSTTQGYLLANVLHEFEDGSAAIVSGARLSNDIDRWRGEIGGGVSHVWETNSTTSYEVFGEVLGSTSLNNVGDSNGVQGTVGFRVLF